MEETSIASVEDSSTSSEESEDESSETSSENSQREESKSSDLEKPEEDLDENRTLRDDSPEHQGLSGSPSRDNIKTALNEGSSELEEKLATCVVTNVPLSELLTKSEFQRFCEEVRGSMKEHNFQQIDGSETSTLCCENTNLRAEVSTLKTQLLDSSHRIQELEQELFRLKAESSLEIVNLKA
ncbi:hypothetical protein L6452_30999 [Arctium lappa]|uniref:Uncharacterized protein n=1 Tax=Arctium lappa TaxID=4217 RepID=A0ACB8ZJJ0_ARCLA|nr:hypothetical protein L6452_30999 [Arctium lappa]